MEPRRYWWGQSAQRPYPPPPDRRTLMSARWHFQGLQAPTAITPIAGYGWFEPALAWIPKAQRPLIYALKDQTTFIDSPLIGDQLYGISLSGRYGEAAYANLPGYDFTKNLSGLNALIDEIVTGAKPGCRRYVRLFCAGDGQCAGPGYNDPVGWTYGAQWLIDFTPTLLASLGDRYRYIQFYPAYDSFWYGWNTPQMTQWGQAMRAIRPDCVMGFEHSIGIMPFGDGGVGLAPNGLADAYDIVSSEYDAGPYLTHEDAVWQIKRRLDPDYTRPADEPGGDDPGPPIHDLGSTSRGPRVHEDLEWGIYPQTHTPNISVDGYDADRRYLKSMSATALIA